MPVDLLSRLQSAVILLEHIMSAVYVFFSPVHSYYQRFKWMILIVNGLSDSTHLVLQLREFTCQLYLYSYFPLQLVDCGIQY